MHRDPLRTILLIGLLLPLAAAAQWPDDPAVTLSIADQSTSQVVPHTALAADGSLYVGWYESPLFGEYEVKLQRLTPAGLEVFPHNGLTVSSHPSEATWVMDWSLIADHDGGAVVAYNDEQAGNFDVHVQKIDPDGNLLWGAAGIQLTDNKSFKCAPRLTAAADGDIVVVWSEGVVRTTLKMQRLSPVGELRFAEGGLRVVGEDHGGNAGGADVIPSAGGDVIVSWVPNDAFESKFRHILIQRFDAEGRPVWKPAVLVFDDGTLPMGHYPSLQSDGKGGALLAWTNLKDNVFNCQAQHLSADGVELWPHNGQLVIDDPTYFYTYPALDYDGAADAAYVVCRSLNYSQGQWGLHGQKLAGDGSRLWGSAGRQYLPVDRTFKSIPRSVLVPGSGPLVLYLTGPSYPPDQEVLAALRVDTEGRYVWPDTAAVVASAPSDKLNVHAVMGLDGAARVIWQDKRYDDGDIYGQSVCADGSVGLPAAALAKRAPDQDGIPGPGAGIRDVYPNPFNPQVTVTFAVDRAQPVQVAVYDLAGRRLAVLADGRFAEGSHDVSWAGQDAAGAAVPSGVYMVQMRAAGMAENRKIMLVR